MNYTDIINFWFQELKPNQWYAKNDELDQSICKRFGETHQKATQCELYSWRETPQGRLAEIIVLDQFSRNIFRDSAKAFAADPLALALSQEAVHSKSDETLPPKERAFLYMPFMHSESAEIHKKAIELFSQSGLDANLDFALKHKAIIDRFGRYPHRNKILGRVSTPEEIEFLQGPGSSF
jgi:uncharacterized protein (DUF924 family)